MGAQDIEEVELGSGQVHQLVCKRHLASLRIDGHGPESTHDRSLRSRLSPRTTQHRTDPGHQFTGTERLGEIVVGSHRQADQLVDLLGAGRQHHDVGISKSAQPTAHLDTVQRGKHQIQHNHVRVLRLGHLQGTQPVSSLSYLEPFSFQVTDNHATNRRFILDDEDAKSRFSAAHRRVHR